MILTFYTAHHYTSNFFVKICLINKLYTNVINIVNLKSFLWKKTIKLNIYSI